MSEDKDRKEDIKRERDKLNELKYKGTWDILSDLTEKKKKK
jgi:hypothetical protein